VRRDSFLQSDQGDGHINQIYECLLFHRCISFLQNFAQLSFGSISSVGVRKCCCDENIARKLIVGTEAADFFFKEGAPFGGKTIFVCLLGLTQTELAAIVFRKPEPGSYKVVNVLKSPMVKAVHGSQSACQVRIGLDQSTGVEISVPWRTV
jgi:hypothetical protein